MNEPGTAPGSFLLGLRKYVHCFSKKLALMYLQFKRKLRLKNKKKKTQNRGLTQDLGFLFVIRRRYRNLVKTCINTRFLMSINGIKLLLYYQPKAICKLLFVAVYPAVVASKIHMSYRTDVINHLSTDRTSLFRSEVAVIALLKIYANFPWCSQVLLISLK